MKNKRNGLIVFALTLIIISSLIIWYGGFDNVKTHYKVQETDLTPHEIDELSLHLFYDPEKRYYHKTEIIIENSKTYIPFVFDTKIISTKNKGVYNINKK